MTNPAEAGLSSLMLRSGLIAPSQPESHKAETKKREGRWLGNMSGTERNIDRYERKGESPNFRILRV